MMECTGQKFGQLEGWKTASLKFGLLDYFFFFFSFSQMGATLVLREKKQTLSHTQCEPITRWWLP